VKTIALLKSNFSRKGGLEKYVERIAFEAARCGHRVVLLTTEYDRPLERSFEVVDFGRRHPSSFFHLLHFDHLVRGWLQDNPCDVIFGFDRNFCPQTHYRAGNGCHAAWLSHREQFSSLFRKWTFTVNPLHILIQEMEKSTFENCHLRYLFANSCLVRDEILEFYPRVDPSKMVVIHNGVEWDELAGPFEEGFCSRAKIQHNLGLDSGCYQFLFVGNEYKRKGLELLLRGLALLTCHDFQLAVCGRDRNEKGFRGMAEKLGIGRNVRFFGEVRDARPFFQAADCAVIPSYYDPFANVTAEALAMGLYVVTSPLNGGKEIIRDASDGAVFGEFTPEAIAFELERAMEQPKNRNIADERRRRIESNTISRQIGTILAYL
jgi:UDP-glucose:(heptosyl)LPS alpha-1,3-glucosyltransferase